MNKGLLSVFLLFVYSSCFSEMISFGDSASSISSPKIAYKKQSIDFKISLAGTYSAQNNWLNENSNSIALRLTLDYLRRIRTNKYLQYYQINSAYGYFKIDSMWMKNTDFCRLKIVFSENNSNTFTHTYTLNVNSQLTKTMRRIYNPLNEISEIKKVSGFLNPGNLTLAYGVNWRFWDDNFINFNLATIKISTRPRYNNFILKDSSNIGKTKNAYVFCEYGMSVNTMIYKKVNDFFDMGKL